MAKTIRKTNANTDVRSNVTTSTKVKAEELQKIAAKTWVEAVDNVLADVAKSAHKLVMDGTANILHALQQNAHSWYVCGEELLKIASAVNERQFSRLISEVYSRFGLSKPTAYRWIGNVEVLAKGVPYEPARDALLTVFGGQGIIVRTDGSSQFAGPIVAGMKKHPAPTTGTYLECMDWAREVQLIAEKAANSNKGSAEEFFKALNARFDKLLKKRYDLAVEHVVMAYRAIEALSEPLAAATFEAIEDSSIAPAEAGKRALASLKQAQQAGPVVKTGVAA